MFTGSPARLHAGFVKSLGCPDATYELLYCNTQHPDWDSLAVFQKLQGRPHTVSVLKPISAPKAAIAAYLEQPFAAYDAPVKVRPACWVSWCTTVPAAMVNNLNGGCQWHMATW
jgi:hypothetical protein